MTPPTTNARPEFAEFPKMLRLFRKCIITEKIDGTNAQVFITESGDLFTGSRNRWITPASDNYGFANWAQAHKEELLKLGPGRHFGEWWGNGIQRGYNQTQKRFSLFNVVRWVEYGKPPGVIDVGRVGKPSEAPKMQQELPECCRLVPILYTGEFSTSVVRGTCDTLRNSGSYAAPGFMRPEGVVIFHLPGNIGFKVTLENDGLSKSQV